MKSEQGQNWLEKLIDLINSTNENCQRIKQLAIKLNDEEAQLMQTINELTGKFKTKDFDWVVRTIIQFKDNIDQAKWKLGQGKIEEGFEEITNMFIEW